MRAWTRRKVLGAGAAAASALACNGARAQERALRITWNGWTEEQTKPLMDGFEAAQPRHQGGLRAHALHPDPADAGSPAVGPHARARRLLGRQPAHGLLRGPRPPGALDGGLGPPAVRQGRPGRARAFAARLYSAPFASSSQVLFYNRALFKAAGVEPPTLGRPEPLDLGEGRGRGAKDVRSGEEPVGLRDRAGGAALPAAALRPVARRQAIGEDGLKASGFIDGQAFVDGFTFMQRLYTDWKVSPPGMFDNTLTPEVFGSGRAAMFLGNTFNYDTFSARYKDLDWGVAPHPYFEKGRPVTPTGSWHIGVNPRSPTRKPQRHLSAT